MRLSLATTAMDAGTGTLSAEQALTIAVGVVVTDIQGVKSTMSTKAPAFQFQ